MQFPGLARQQTNFQVTHFKYKISYFHKYFSCTAVALWDSSLKEKTLATKRALIYFNKTFYYLHYGISHIKRAHFRPHYIRVFTLAFWLVNVRKQLQKYKASEVVLRTGSAPARLISILLRRESFVVLLLHLSSVASF